MRCPECADANERSRVYCQGSSSTAMAEETYWDEFERLHHHDLNTVTAEFNCSRGHHWLIDSKRACPSSEVCGFDGSQTVRRLAQP